MINVRIYNSDKSSRGVLLENLIKSLNGYSLQNNNKDKVDVVFFLSPTLLKSIHANKPVEEYLKFKDNNSSVIFILDVCSPQVFLDQNKDKEASLLALCIAHADFVTCDSPETQEIIYEFTGILAYIIDNPFTEEDFKEPDCIDFKDISNLNIVWFGELEEIFSVVKEKNIIKKVIPYNLSYYKYLKKIEKNIDIVYLPKTFTIESEYNRILKVKLCLLEGKFVVAPEIELAYPSLETLHKIEKSEDFIIDKQKELLKLQDFENSKAQLEYGIDLAVKNVYSNNKEKNGAY